MKVCLFTTTIDKNDGGPSRSVPILARGLASIGVDTTIMTCLSDNMNTHLLDGTSVNLQFIPRNIKYRQLESILMASQFEIIHGQNLWMPLYHKMAQFAQKNNIPYIMTPRGCLEPWCLKQKYIKKKLAFLLFQKSDLENAACILATSRMEANNIKKLGITAPISIIPNGIDIAEYKCRSIDSKRFVKKQICFISRLHEKKGIEFLIDAWEVLQNKYPEWTILIVGNGEEKYVNILREKIKNKGLERTVMILPPIFGGKKYKLYSESSLFVLPTHSENFGMVIAEAMSCGVPVITTQGTPWNQINDLGLGWCITLNLDNLINTMDKAISKGVDELFDMGQKCNKYISKTYQYTEVARKNMETYEWILGQRPKPNFVELSAMVE